MELQEGTSFWDHHIGGEEKWHGWIRGFGEGVGVACRNQVLLEVKSRGVNQTGDKYLDVGCGGGIDLENLLVHGILPEKYTGLDGSTNAIEFCKKAFSKWENIAEFMVGDANNLPFPADSYEIVTLRHVLDHCEYYTQPLSEALRVANKLVYITLWTLLGENDKVRRYEEGGFVGYNSRYEEKKFLEFCGSFGWHVTYARFHQPGRLNDVIWIRNPEHVDFPFKILDKSGRPNLKGD